MKKLLFGLLLLVGCSSPQILTTGDVYYYKQYQLDSLNIPKDLPSIQLKGTETKELHTKYFYFEGDSILYNIEQINDSIFETNKIRIK